MQAQRKACVARPLERVCIKSLSGRTYTQLLCTVIRTPSPRGPAPLFSFSWRISEDRIRALCARACGAISPRAHGATRIRERRSDPEAERGGEADPSEIDRTESAIRGIFNSRASTSSDVAVAASHLCGCGLWLCRLGPCAPGSGRDIPDTEVRTGTGSTRRSRSVRRSQIGFHMPRRRAARKAPRDADVRRMSMTMCDARPRAPCRLAQGRSVNKKSLRLFFKRCLQPRAMAF